MKTLKDLIDKVYKNPTYKAYIEALVNDYRVNGYRENQDDIFDKVDRQLATAAVISESNVSQSDFEQLYNKNIRTLNSFIDNEIPFPGHDIFDSWEDWLEEYKYNDQIEEDLQKDREFFESLTN